MAGRVVELRAGAREPQVGDRLAWDGMGWVPEVNIARPHGVTHVHTETVVHVVMGPWRSPDFVSGSSGWQFDADGSLEANNITARGTIIATAGEIGGWTIEAGHLYAGSGAARVGLKPGTYPFYAGAEAEASAPFRVNTGGEMWATNAHITGEITATTGTIGGWTISATEIKSGTNIVLDSSVPKIEIGSSGYIRSNNYVSGFDGFYIDDDFAEFGNVNVRGSLHCAVFVKDLISAHAGTLLVTKSAGKLDADYTVTDLMTVETPPGGGWLFDSQDIIRLREEYAGGVHESWVKVVRSMIENIYSSMLLSGDNTTYHKGTTAVDYGQSGDGGILQTADMTNAPWLSVFTHAGAPWTTLTHHLRLGNLKGTGDFAADAYGIFIGDYSGNKWMSYDPTNSLRIRGDAVIDGTITGDKIVANTILATNLSMGIGDNIFNAADGLLLLGPNCEINDGEWWSLRRQKATITGAFHQEAGRWLGTRGLVVEEATTNLETNPSMELGNPPTGYDDFYTPTRSQTSVYAKFGTYCQRVIADAANDGVRDTITASAETTYTFSVWMRADTPTTVNLRCYDQDNNSLGGAVACAVGITWERFKGTFTTGVGDTGIKPVLYATGASTFYVDGWQLEEKGYATTYCDGTQGHEYTWAGTAHASTSTRVITTVDLDDLSRLIRDNSTVSFRVVAQMPYDADETWPTQYATLMGARGADSNNRYNIIYDYTQDRFEVYINGDYRLYSVAQTFDAGDWVDVVVTLDFTNDEYNLYLNGELEDTDTTSLTAPTMTTWQVGANYAGGSQAGYNIVEYATLDKVLTATEVAAMYALQRPLADAGAMDSPGIYILDGRFKMASSLAGNRIEIDAEEIAGYNSVGTKQFYLRASDGTALAAGGKWLVDAGGQRIRTGTSEQDSRRIRWIYDDANDDKIASLGACWESTFIISGKQNSHLFLRTERVTGDGWADAAMTLDVNDYVDSRNAYIDLFASSRVISVSDNLFLGVGTFPVESGDIWGARGVISMRNVHTLPSANPTWGGFLYSQGGAGKWRGSGGTITTFGPAEPHCPRCGRDFVLEWENQKQGTHLQVCIWCLTEAVEALEAAEGRTSIDQYVMKKTGPAVVERRPVRSMAAPPVRPVERR